MDFRSSHQSDNAKPKRLKTLVCSVQFPGRNTLLHQFVLDNSRPNEWGGENYIAAVLQSMSGVPGDVTNALNGNGYTALHLAVLKDNLLLVNKLLSCPLHIDVNARSRGNRDTAPYVGAIYRCYESTALHLAASLGNLPIIQELLDKGASIDIGDRNGKTALCIAAESGALEIMKFLVSKGANVNQGCLFGTPVCCAVETGNLDCVEFLVSSGARLNARSGCSFSTLHSAVWKADLNMVGFLIAQGAELDPILALNYELDQLDIFGGPLGYEHFDMMFTLLDDMMFTLLDDGLEYFEATAQLPDAELEHFNVIPPVQCSVLDSVHQSDPLHRDDDGFLQVAAFLIEKGVYKHAAVKDKKLLHEVHGKILKCAEVLLREGSDLKASTTVDGWTPLHAAAYTGHAEMIREFLDKGADANARNNDGMTPLDLAREKGNQSCIDALKNVG